MDLVVHTERGPDGPRLTGILAVEDLVAGPEAVNFTVTELFSPDGRTGRLAWTGDLPVCAAERMAARGVDIADALGGDGS